MGFKNVSRPSTAVTAACCLAGLLAAPAQAFGPAFLCEGNPILWNRTPSTLYLSTTTFPIGSPWDLQLQKAMSEWNGIWSSFWSFDLGRDLDGTHATGNGVNEVYGTDELPSGTIGHTDILFSCYWFFGLHYGIEETDIQFSSDVTWNTGSFDSSDLGEPYHFGVVALHEMGHAMGLTHSNGGQAPRPQCDRSTERQQPQAVEGEMGQVSMDQLVG